VDLGFHRHNHDGSSPDRPELFRVPIVGAVSPFDYVLAGMIAAGLGIEAICLYLGTAKTVLLERLAALGLATPHDRPLRRSGGKNPWTAGETRQFLGWWVEGVQVACMAEALGRSRGALYGKRARLGLPARNRKRLVFRTAKELVAAAHHDGSAASQAAPFVAVPPSPEARPRGAAVSEASPAGVSDAARAAERAAWVADPAFGGAAEDATGTEVQDAARGVAGSVAGCSGPIVVPEAPPESKCRGSGSDGPRIVGRGRPRRADGTTTSGTDKARCVAPGEVVREDPGMLVAAFDEMRRSWIDRLRQWAGKGDDWAWRNDEELFEFVLRGVGNQLPGSIARDMSFGYSQVAVRLSRLEIVRSRKRLVDRFDLGAACRRMREERHVLRGCGMRRTPFVSLRKDNILFCREARESEKYRSRWSEVNCAAAFV